MLYIYISHNYLSHRLIVASPAGRRRRGSGRERRLGHCIYINTHTHICICVCVCVLYISYPYLSYRRLAVASRGDIAAGQWRRGSGRERRLGHYIYIYIYIYTHIHTRIYIYIYIYLSIYLYLSISPPPPYLSRHRLAIASRGDIPAGRRRRGSGRERRLGHGRCSEKGGGEEVGGLVDSRWAGRLRDRIKGWTLCLTT